MITIIYSTFPNQAEAERIVVHLLKQQLIACATMFPVESAFFWNSTVSQEQECAIIAKTTQDRARAVVAEIEKMHSYDIPCILTMPVDGNELYKQYVNAHVSRKTD
jgi:periplasmic divalent cation tolerance protein